MSFSPPVSMSSEDNSNTASYANTGAIDTGFTSPGEAPGLAFATVTISQPISSLNALEEAFIADEPFKQWACSFCTKSNEDCSCRALETTPGPIPHTKGEFLAYLLNERNEATLLQHATVSYLLAIDESVPFGEAFNQDQHQKCGVMNDQLELVKARISDLVKAVRLVSAADDDSVPSGLLNACSYFRDVLNNCYGNVRENHITYKLNYLLCVGK